MNSIIFLASIAAFASAKYEGYIITTPEASNESRWDGTDGWQEFNMTFWVPGWVN